MSTQSSIRSLIEAVLFGIALFICYLLAAYLPVSFGWENGILENAQVLLLLAGGVYAARSAIVSSSKRSKIFWAIVIPVWFMLALRELSWGAMFHTPLAFSEETGPVFSSGLQLWYKPAVAPVCAAILLVCLAVFLKTRQGRTVKALWQIRHIPLLQLFIGCVCLWVSAASEGHMDIDMAHLGEGASQVFEEAAELCGYLALLLAQCRVAQGMKQLEKNPERIPSLRYPS